ncbi:hypothetical protein STANM309S_06619 [Streptomyces tanashiensis]
MPVSALIAGSRMLTAEVSASTTRVETQVAMSTAAGADVPASSWAAPCSWDIHRGGVTPGAPPRSSATATGTRRAAPVPITARDGPPQEIRSGLREPQ